MKRPAYKIANRPYALTAIIASIAAFQGPAEALASPTAASAKSAVEVLSHRANYRLSLHNTGRNASMESIRGRLMIETNEICQGHVSNQEMAFIADTKGGPSFNYGMHFSSWESSDLEQMRFLVKSYNDNEVFEEFSGSASLLAGQPLAAYDKPEEINLPLPSETIFPTTHLKQLIESALNNELVMNSTVFDGSNPEAMTTVTAVIGRAQTVAADASVLAGETSWPVSLAYYLVGSESDLPDYEISFNMTKDGVLNDLILDYGDFALAAELVELNSLGKPDCG